MPPAAPANIVVLAPLVLGAVGEIAARIPAARVRVDGRVEVDVAEVVGDEGAGGDDFVASAGDRDGVVRCVFAEAGAGGLAADAFAEAEVDGREFGLPGFERDGVETLGEGRGVGVAVVVVAGSVFVGDGEDFGADAR